MPDNLAAELQALDASVPKDRTQEWEQSRQRLPEAVRQRHQTEQSLADGEVRLEDAQRRRWGRHDHRAIADAQAQLAALHQQAERAAAEERRLRDHLAELADHQRAREHHIADSAGRRGQRAETVAELDDALDRTRVDRVRRLADDPPEHLVTRLGAPPGSGAGRAVWCHHALRIEADRDHSDGRTPRASRSDDDRACHEIAVAHQLLQSDSDQPGPAVWADLAEQARTTAHPPRHR